MATQKNDQLLTKEDFDRSMGVLIEHLGGQFAHMAEAIDQVDQKVIKVGECTEKLEHDLTMIRLQTSGLDHDLRLIKIRTEKFDKAIAQLNDHEHRITKLETKAA